MALITGTPIGTIVSPDDIRLEGAPNIWYQDSRATPLYNPDSDGFYFGLSATVAYPVYELGCIEGVQLTENLTINDVQCDTVGFIDTIMRRNYLELNLTLKTIFPLAAMRALLRGGPVTSGNGLEKMGLGVVDNGASPFRLYLAKVYDETNADYLSMTLHRCKFVDAWTIDFRYGQEWQITGLKVRAYGLSSYPSAQQFATIIRRDPSAIS